MIMEFCHQFAKGHEITDEPCSCEVVMLVTKYILKYVLLFPFAVGYLFFCLRSLIILAREALSYF